VSNARSRQLLHTHVADTPQTGKRILLVRTDRLGDVILTLPMLPLLRKCFPGAYIAMLLREYTAELVEGNPHVDELLSYDDGQSLIPFTEMLRRIQTKNFDIAIVVHPTPRLAWLMFRARIPERVGSGFRYYSILFNRRVYEHRKDAKRHELEYNLNLLKKLDCPVGGKPEFSLLVPPEVCSKVDNLFESLGVDREKEIIVVHPGTGGSAKEWPADYFGHLAARLQTERDCQILITGSKAEEHKVARVFTGTKEKAISLAGRLSLKELTAVIKRATLFISNSTGPLHIAVAVGTPVLCMFPQITTMNAVRWGPYTLKKRVLVPDKPVDCTECTNEKEHPCACMMSISVDQAYDAACSLLAETKNKESVPND
jgi:heptosyltransferase III